jgi:organic hydroperoxide reductase OsmC/OhrA
MSRTATYHTTVQWKGEHWGHIRMGNGPEMDFSAPPDTHGHSGLLTPEDAFVAAVNTCVMMMFIWSAERFKLKLVSFECYAEGTKLIELDRTETFTHVTLRPRIGSLILLSIFREIGFYSFDRELSQSIAKAITRESTRAWRSL